MLDAKIQENPHPHQTSREKNKDVAQGMSLQCETSCEKWSGDMPQEWIPKRLVQVTSEMYVMMMEATSTRK